MALKLNERYPQRWDSPSNDYPQGAFKNLTELGEQDGSYLEQDWLNDYSGFFGALLRNAEMTPDGTIDTAQRSQFYDALVKVAKESVDLSDLDNSVRAVDIKANNAQSRADSAYNLANSKQDKLEFVGNGKVMKEGASGLAGLAEYYSEQTREALLGWVYKSGIYSFQGVGGEFGFPISFIAVNGEKGKLGESQVGIHISTNQRLVHISSILGTGEIALYKLLHTSNTTVDKSGFLRASGSANALTTSDVTQSLGTSTTLVASQALVNSVSEQVAGHGLGYGQEWVDVRSQRVAGTTYTNNTGRPIVVIVDHSASRDSIFKVIYNGVTTTLQGDSSIAGYAFSCVVPNGYSYVFTGANIILWSELR